VTLPQPAPPGAAPSSDRRKSVNGAALGIAEERMDTVELVPPSQAAVTGSRIRGWITR
jgi:hypothetical protein